MFQVTFRKDKVMSFFWRKYNLDIKSGIRLGICTDNMWLSVCRNVYRLNELRSKLKHFSVIGPLMAQVPEKSIYAISDWSVCLTEKEYILNSKFFYEYVQLNAAEIYRRS